MPIPPKGLSNPPYSVTDPCSISVRKNDVIDWRQVWERKGAAHVDAYDLAALLRLDGYDDAGKLEPDDFRAFARLVERQLALESGMRVLDVGCGAGALLWCLRSRGLELLGVDYSSTLIEHARRAIPEARFAVAEASSIPFEADALVCCGVFQYFPSLDHARRVLAEFRRVAPVALILHIPDLALREEAEHARRAGGSKMGTHLYYPRSFFIDAKLQADEAPGYPLAPFYFNAFFDSRRPAPPRH